MAKFGSWSKIKELMSAHHRRTSGVEESTWGALSLSSLKFHTNAIHQGTELTRRRLLGSHIFNPSIDLYHSIQEPCIGIVDVQLLLFRLFPTSSHPHPVKVSLLECRQRTGTSD